MSNEPRVTRRSLLVGAAAIGAAAAGRIGHEANAEGAIGAPVGIELFPSQGCSSCPPADAVLGSLARRPDIVALSFHVDYWNYLGWKDPFSSPETTARQRLYGHALHQESIYTPEMVVDGRAHTPCVYRDSLSSLIQKRARLRERERHRHRCYHSIEIAA